MLPAHHQLRRSDSRGESWLPLPAENPPQQLPKLRNTLSWTHTVVKEYHKTFPLSFLGELVGPLMHGRWLLCRL
jgi:hypothetical protein